MTLSLACDLLDGEIYKIPREVRLFCFASNVKAKEVENGKQTIFISIVIFNHSTVPVDKLRTVNSKSFLRVLQMSQW